jgi:hypothetical protein
MWVEGCVLLIIVLVVIGLLWRQHSVRMRPSVSTDEVVPSVSAPPVSTPPPNPTTDSSPTISQVTGAAEPTTVLVMHRGKGGVSQWKKAIGGLPLKCIYSTGSPGDWSEQRNVPVVWLGETIRDSAGFERNHPGVCRAMIFWYPEGDVVRELGADYSFLVAPRSCNKSDEHYAHLADRRYYADGTSEMRETIVEILRAL